MKDQPRVSGRGRRVVVGRRVPHSHTVGRTIPLTDVIEAQPVIKGQLSIRFVRVLSIQRPLMELDIEGRNNVLLLVIAVDSEQEVSNHVSGIVSSPADVVVTLVA